MKVQRSGLLQLILLFLFAMAIVRFLPAIVHAIQAAAIAGRVFWWLILPVLVINWISWRMFKRGSIAKKSENQAGTERCRDVTNSANEQLKKNSDKICLIKISEQDMNKS